MKQKILAVTLLACLCGTAYANECEIKLSPGTTVESIGKITCQKSVEVIDTKKEEKKIEKTAEKPAVKPSIKYEVKKGQGIAQTLKAKHPELSVAEANKEALRVAEALNLKVTKSQNNEYVVIVKPGFTFYRNSEGGYHK